MLSTLIEFLFGIALFVNAALFIPQAWRIYRKKSSEGVSLLTFGGFWLIQLVTVLHGYLHQDHLLFWGFFLSLVTNGCVIILA
ncbi:MAG TPA: PQ-loop repeat-containing protein, partial [Coxiellaceae bacterium]|nr:PQ-loop repeat-containing protein [Coxiellaceae bacterium]